MIRTNALGGFIQATLESRKKKCNHLELYQTHRHSYYGKHAQKRVVGWA